MQQTTTTTTTTTTKTVTNPQTVFVEQHGGTCQNLCETPETGEAAQAIARNYARSGKLIQISGKFIWEMNKVVGIEREDGERLYKNDEGFYHCEDVVKFATV